MKVCAADDDTVGSCKTANATASNVNPTAVIELAGATVVNGTLTFVAHVGQSIPFDGTSADPGSDDLTTSWNGDDGPPAPDVSTPSLVNPPTPDPLRARRCSHATSRRCHSSGW